MSREVDRIADQMRRAWSGDAWLGTSLAELLADVAAEEAHAKPIAGAHSIWELVNHIAVWEDAARRRVEGNPARIEISSDEDWPPVGDTSEAAWNAARAHLALTQDALLRAIAGMSDARLDEIVGAGHDQTLYVLLHGVVQHDTYHGGQISLLKRALRPRPGGGAK
ncbi:MAG: DinB family protein [bacterium]